MTKSSKSNKPNWAVVNESGRIVRDIVAHRQAVYSTRSRAREALRFGEARGGQKVVNLSA